MSITILVFIFSILFPRKTNMIKFFKKLTKNYFGVILGPFCPNLGKNEFSWKRRFCQFFNIWIIYHFWENCWTDTQQVLESCDWLKNLAIWLARSILGHISGTRIFPNIKLVQPYCNYSNINFNFSPNWEKIKELRKNSNFPIHSKIPRLGLFSRFWGGTSHEPLTPCWVSEKTKEPIQRKLPNRRTDRPHSYDPSGHDQGSYKRISQLRGITVDNKNKIQYSSA